MSTTEIILAILTSSVFSAILTSFFNWKLHNSNYKKDYYKKLLDKRLNAYEDLNRFINILSNIVYTEKGMIHGLFCGSVGFNHISSELRKTQEKSFWLDDITGHKLTELSVFLFNNVSGKIDDSLPEEVTREKYYELGIEHYQKIEEFKGTLKFFMNNELKRLYKVEDFFNDDRIGSKTYPVYEKEINK
ncbi:hypothetical protein [Wocania ichthyoenteri]|uniref:hypothetical protein n=1 Tax=Wocania ichthyoenteri TaxID=1230531 RepID=UPI00053E5A62|nr:hypothetical protein [Wocania ichthyoenteri]